MDLRLILALVLIAGLATFVAHHTDMMNAMVPKGPSHSESKDAHGDHPEDTKSTNANVHTVRMVSEDGGFHFEPHIVHVEPGDTVRWVLESGRHTATSYDPSNGTPLRIPEGANGWDSGMLSESGETFEKTFQIEGVYDYFCVPHEGAGMIGTVVVGEAHEGPGLAEPQPELPEEARTKIRELNASARNPEAGGEANHHE